MSLLDECERAASAAALDPARYADCKRLLQLTCQPEELAGWMSTSQGLVRGHWRLYRAETWCVAVRAPDAERMVARGFSSAEDAAGWVCTLPSQGLVPPPAPTPEEMAAAWALGEDASFGAQSAYACGVRDERERQARLVKSPESP